MSPKRCGNCGSTNMARINQRGKAYPWRDYRAIKLLNDDLILLECKECNETIVNGSELSKIDRAIEKSIAIMVQSYLEAILLREHCSQAAIADHLGLTEEYLSEIKSGRKTPKFGTFNFLKSMALSHEVFTASDPEVEVEISA